MSKIVIEVDSSDTAEIRRIIERLKKQVKANRDHYSEQVHEDRLKQVLPGIEPFLPQVKVSSVFNLGFHYKYHIENAGIETLEDLVGMSRSDLMLIQGVGNMVVNEIESFLWSVYGKRLSNN